MLLGRRSLRATTIKSEESCEVFLCICSNRVMNRSSGSYEDFYINDLCTKGDKHKLMYIDISDYNILTKQFTKFLVGTSSLKISKNKHSLGLFDTTNVKKRRYLKRQDTSLAAIGVSPILLRLLYLHYFQTGKYIKLANL